MCWESGINDSAGNRFRVASAFIDTMYKYFPASEVGFTVFQRYLYFRPGDNPLFAQCSPPQDTLGAFIPLFTLNKDYNGQSGREIVQALLETHPTTAPDYSNSPGRPYVDLVYKPSANWLDSTSPGTHINAAFEAARNAFISSEYPKKDHYLIFLSDGEANWPPTGANDFVQGTKL
jgi:hypothetical protein